MAFTSSCGLICMEQQGPDGDPCIACAERWNQPTFHPTSNQRPKLIKEHAMEPTSTESSPSMKQPHNILENMPTEITCRIFEHSTRSDNPDWPLNLPFKLGNVCSQWRQIAWSTPSLWTHVSFSIEKVNLSHRIDLLEEIIPRSGTLLLTFKLTGVGIFDEKSHPPTTFKTSDDFQRFTRCLYKCSERWYSFDFILLDMSYVIPLFQLLPYAPNLQKLHVFLFTIDMDTASPGLDIDLATLAPNIQKFQNTYHPDLGTLSIRWDKLIELRLGSEMSAILAAAQKSTLLRHLQIIVRDAPESATLQPRTLFTHTNLRSVHIEDADHAITFFSSVAVPNLKDLSLSTGDLNGISLAAALERSCRGRTLTRLKLYEVKVGDDIQSSEGIYAILGVLPSLTELELSYKHIRGRAEEYCGAVFRPFGSEKRALLPNLQVFHLEVGSDGLDDFQFLGKAFEHTQRFSLPLRELSINLQVHRERSWLDNVAGLGSLDPELLRQIQAFRMKGGLFEL